jgi:hypothetical protein
MRSESIRSGVIETLFVLAAFVAFGLGWAEFVARAPAVGSPYPAQMVDDTRAEPSIWLLDGFNVLHAGPLGGRDRSEWWTAPRRDELLEIAARFDDRSAEVWVVFDGPREADRRDDATRSSHRPPTPGCSSRSARRTTRAESPSSPQTARSPTALGIAARASTRRAISSHVAKHQPAHSAAEGSALVPTSTPGVNPTGIHAQKPPRDP